MILEAKSAGDKFIIIKKPRSSEYVHPKDHVYHEIPNRCGCAPKKVQLRLRMCPECRHVGVDSHGPRLLQNSHPDLRYVGLQPIKPDTFIRKVDRAEKVHERHIYEENCNLCEESFQRKYPVDDMRCNQSSSSQSTVSSSCAPRIRQFHRVPQMGFTGKAYKNHRNKNPSMLKRWKSEDSMVFLTNEPLLDHGRHERKSRHVSISDSKEVLYDVPLIFESSNQSSVKSAYSPLKSALKSRNPKFISPAHNIIREESFRDSLDVYDPSLPHIPLSDDTMTSTDSAILSMGSGGSSEVRIVDGYRYIAKTPPKPLIAIGTSLAEWYQAIEATSTLGWATLLYLAVRSNYRPLAFAKMLFQGNRVFVRATADYVTREPTLLSFRKGDIIIISNSDTPTGSEGWLRGNLDGRTGMFPVEYVTPIKYSTGRSEARHIKNNDGIDDGLIEEKITTKTHTERTQIRNTSPLSEDGETITWNKSRNGPRQHDDSGHSSAGEAINETQESNAMPKPPVDDGKHSLFQFALQHFRGAKESVAATGSLQTTGQKKKKKNSKDGSEWTWKQLVELVKFSQSPLTQSLLPLEGELGHLALETFIAVMRYMGDYPMDEQQTEVHCVYTILMNCHKHEALRDEVYCQVMKQTTNNKSSIPQSCQRGWRLFSMIAAYFTCSDVLKPYLLKYLETNAYDKRRAFHGTAMFCLQNVRKTFRYGGRKNVPSIEEITAITAGRISKRQIYRLPGGTERVINTKSTSVVQDIIEELCVMINVRSALEQEEFSLYCIVEGDPFTMPLAREEYVLDVTTELLKNQQVFYLIFCRSVFYHPLRLDNSLYIEVVFNQIAPDYLAGLLLVTPGDHLDQESVYDIAKIAALMHRAADLDAVPTIKEVRFLLPKPILTARDVKPQQWLNLVQGSWSDVASLPSMGAKAAVLEILQNWPLFGSAFFAVERVTEPEEFMENILALNKRGVHFLDAVTHETLITYSLDKILSTRKVKGNDGQLYLDMKCGNLMKPRILTVRTAQAHEISRQIRQYIIIEQRVSDGGRGDNPKDLTLSR